MSRDSFATAAVLIFLALLPLAGIVYVGHKAKPKDRKATIQEIYPDEHFFI